MPNLRPLTPAESEKISAKGFDPGEYVADDSGRAINRAAIASMDAGGLQQSFGLSPRDAGIYSQRGPITSALTEGLSRMGAGLFGAGEKLTGIDKLGELRRESQNVAEIMASKRQPGGLDTALGIGAGLATQVPLYVASLPAAAAINAFASGGEGAQRTEEAGGTGGQQVLNAVLRGGTSALTDIAGAKFAVPAAKAIMQSAKPAAQRAGAMLVPAAFGAAENVTAQIGANVADKVTFNPNKDLMEGTATSALVGFAIPAAVGARQAFGGSGSVTRPSPRAIVEEGNRLPFDQREAFVARVNKENPGLFGAEGLTLARLGGAEGNRMSDADIRAIIELGGKTGEPVPLASANQELVARLAREGLIDPTNIAEARRVLNEGPTAFADIQARNAGLLAASRVNEVTAAQTAAEAAAKGDVSGSVKIAAEMDAARQAERAKLEAQQGAARTEARAADDAETALRAEYELPENYMFKAIDTKGKIAEARAYDKARASGFRSAITGETRYAPESDLGRLQEESLRSINPPERPMSAEQTLLAERELGEVNRMKAGADEQAKAATAAAAAQNVNTRVPAAETIVTGEATLPKTPPPGPKDETTEANAKTPKTTAPTTPPVGNDAAENANQPSQAPTGTPKVPGKSDAAPTSVKFKAGTASDSSRVEPVQPVASTPNPSTAEVVSAGGAQAATPVQAPKLSINDQIKQSYQRAVDKGDTKTAKELATLLRNRGLPVPDNAAAPPVTSAVKLNTPDVANLSTIARDLGAEANAVNLEALKLEMAGDSAGADKLRADFEAKRRATLAPTSALPKTEVAPPVATVKAEPAIKTEGLQAKVFGGIVPDAFGPTAKVTIAVNTKQIEGQTRADLINVLPESVRGLVKDVSLNRGSVLETGDKATVTPAKINIVANTLDDARKIHQALGGDGKTTNEKVTAPKLTDAEKAELQAELAGESKTPLKEGVESDLNSYVKRRAKEEKVGSGAKMTNRNFDRFKAEYEAGGVPPKMAAPAPLKIKSQTADPIAADKALLDQVGLVVRKKPDGAYELYNKEIDEVVRPLGEAANEAEAVALAARSMRESSKAQSTKIPKETVRSMSLEEAYSRQNDIRWEDLSAEQARYINKRNVDGLMEALSGEEADVDVTPKARKKAKLKSSMARRAAAAAEEYKDSNPKLAAEQREISDAAEAYFKRYGQEPDGDPRGIGAINEEEGGSTTRKSGGFGSKMRESRADEAGFVINPAELIEAGGRVVAAAARPILTRIRSATNQLGDHATRTGNETAAYGHRKLNETATVAAVDATKIINESQSFWNKLSSAERGELTDVLQYERAWRKEWPSDMSPKVKQAYLETRNLMRELGERAGKEGPRIQEGKEWRPLIVDEFWVPESLSAKVVKELQDTSIDKATGRPKRDVKLDEFRDWARQNGLSDKQIDTEIKRFDIENKTADADLEFDALHRPMTIPLPPGWAGNTQDAINRYATKYAFEMARHKYIDQDTLLGPMSRGQRESLDDLGRLTQRLDEAGQVGDTTDALFRAALNSFALQVNPGRQTVAQRLSSVANPLAVQTGATIRDTVNMFGTLVDDAGVKNSIKGVLDGVTKYRSLKERGLVRDTGNLSGDAQRVGEAFENGQVLETFRDALRAANRLAGVDALNKFMQAVSSAAGVARAKEAMAKNDEAFFKKVGIPEWRSKTPAEVEDFVARWVVEGSQGSMGAKDQPTHLLKSSGAGAQFFPIMKWAFAFSNQQIDRAWKPLMDASLTPLERVKPLATRLAGAAGASAVANTLLQTMLGRDDRNPSFKEWEAAGYPNKLKYLVQKMSDLQVLPAITAFANVVVGNQQMPRNLGVEVIPNLIQQAAALQEIKRDYSYEDYVKAVDALADKVSSNWRDLSKVATGETKDEIEQARARYEGMNTAVRPAMAANPLNLATQFNKAKTVDELKEIAQRIVSTANLDTPDVSVKGPSEDAAFDKWLELSNPELSKQYRKQNTLAGAGLDQMYETKKVLAEAVNKALEQKKLLLMSKEPNAVQRAKALKIDWKEGGKYEVK